MKILTVTNLRKSYFGRQILNGVNLTINSGEFVCITGSNGSGKTVLLNIIMGLIDPDLGTVKFWGDQLISPEIRREIGIVNVASRLYRHLTPLENITFYNEIYKLKNNDKKIERLFCLFDLENYLHDKRITMEKLSSGQNVKVHLIKALLGNPKIVVLDEPTAYLDKESKSQIIKALLTYKSQHKAAYLISSHSQNIIRICDRKLILRDGKLT